MRLLKHTGLMILTGALFTLAGCEDQLTDPHTTTEIPSDNNVSLSMGIPGGTASPASRLGKISGANGVITLSRVRLLLDELKLKSEFEDSVDFEIGPLVVDLNLNGQITEIGVGSVPIGLYKEFEFEVEHLDEDEVDTTATEFADFRGSEKSIIIEGVFNGEAFTLAIEEEFEQETELMPLLEIATDTTTTNLTLNVDVSHWFSGTDSAEVLDPTDPNNIEQIENNIEASFEVFEDEDGDGGLDFDGDVIAVDVDNNSFTLEDGLTVVIDNNTVFEGSILDLTSVKNLLSQEKQVEADGEGAKQENGSILASEIKFEFEDEDD